MPRLPLLVILPALALAACPAAEDASEDTGSEGGDEGEDGTDGETEGGDEGDTDGDTFACSSAFGSCDADPVGEWQLNSFCDYEPLDCRDAEIVSDIGTSTMGTLTFNADGTVVWDLNISISARMEGPRTCVDPIVHDTCGDDPELCEWIFGGGPSGQDMGVWEVRDGKVIINPDAVETEFLAGAEFCADGGELSVQWVADWRAGWRGNLSRQ